MDIQHRVIAGEAEPGFYGVRTDDGERAAANEAVFPIVATDDAGGIELIGTGFFIAENGIFATAAHVVTHVLNAQGSPVKSLAIFQFFPGNKCAFRPIHRTVHHERSDVAVGVAWPMHHNETGAPAPNKLLTLSARQARIALSVSTYAYPKTTIHLGRPNRLNFDGAFFDGVITERFPNGRDRVMLPGPCYRTSMVIHGGASGGPVLAANGTVVGINSTGIGEEPVSFASCITSIFELAISGIIIPGSDQPQTVTIARLIDLGFVLRR